VIPDPPYVALAASGELARRAAAFARWLDPCDLCPRACGAHRRAGEVGVCGVGAQAVVARACAHRGEEPPLSGTRGAGTVFFAGCNLGCRYCQNHQISGSTAGWTAVSAAGLAEIYLSLQGQGCHNLEWVTASHVLPQAVEALDLAARQGLRLPVVHNTSAYERVEVLRLLEGVVSVYLPDLKYGAAGPAAAWSDAPDYVAVSLAALREMARQVGRRLRVDEHGVAEQGLIVRHLVLPGDASGTAAVLRRVAEELGPRAAVSLMAQYRPPPEVALAAPLDRPITRVEYEAAVAALEAEGLGEGWVQALESESTYVPDFAREGHPFDDE
jgi:putative pyruvate formate lyase activating enzyme